jgi:hypothetical protein
MAGRFLHQASVQRGTGSFDSVDLGAIAALMHNPWIDGTGAAKYEFRASGLGLHDLLNSANLSGDFAIREGNFPHIALTSQSSGLRANSFSGRLLLRDGQFSFPDAKLESATGVYKVSGTVSLTGGLNLKMTGERPGFSLSELCGYSDHRRAGCSQTVKPSTVSLLALLCCVGRSLAGLV